MELERDLTPEGQRLFDNLLNYEELYYTTGSKTKVLTQEPPPKPPKKTREQYEQEHFRNEIAKIIVNSLLVIEDCDEVINKYETAEEYLKSDVKVAKFIHTNFVARLSRVLDMKPAFEDDSHLRIDVRNMKQQISNLTLFKIKIGATIST